MISDFREQPTLVGARLRLEPLSLAHLGGYLPMLAEPEGRRLTGTHAEFTEDQVRRWLATRADHDDRADWAIVLADGAFAGEVVLSELDQDNACVDFRISLAGPHVFGLGIGTAATELVLDYALGDVGLHRVQLEVYSMNPRALRVYEKCGFVREGVRRDALLWEGGRYDAVTMAVLATDPRPTARRMVQTI